MEANGYSSRTVFRRLPRLFCFAEFAQKRGCTDVASALALVEDFVSQWLVQHGPEAKTSASLRKHAIDVGNATRQMLRLASGDPVRHNRHRRPFPLEAEVPGFQEYLRNECGLMESTIQGYRHHLHEFGQYLRKAGITSFGDLSPALLASFIVECAPGMAPCTRRDLCCHLKVLLRFCHREGITDRDLRGAVGMPQVYRLADVPRSITWDEVRRTLESVDRRTIRGRRDCAILLFLVTYGPRAHEVAEFTLEDIDWKRERFQVPERKAVLQAETVQSGYLSGFFKYSDRDDDPERSSTVPSFASERIPGANPGPYVSRKVRTSVSLRFLRISPFRS
jgi:hypothetical protein